MMNNIQINEEWKWLYGSTTHQVSNYGRIVSVDRTVTLKSGKVVEKEGKEYFMKQNLKNPRHVFCTFMTYDNLGELKQNKIYAHRAVADHFVPKPAQHNENDFNLNYQLAVHIDGDFFNNHYSNFKWVTIGEMIKSQPVRKAALLESYKFKQLEKLARENIRSEEVRTFLDGLSDKDLKEVKDYVLWIIERRCK